MGMRAFLRQASESELAEYRRNPDSFYNSLKKGYEAMLDEALLLESVEHGDLSAEEEAEVDKLFLGVINRTAVAGPNGPDLQLEKSWHCLRYIFTGKVMEPPGMEPLDRSVLGAREIPDQAKIMGYGPVRCLTSAEVKEVAAALCTFPIVAKAKEFNESEAERKQVYCPNHSEDELIHYFGKLLGYYEDAAARGNGMLMWIE
ncbi:MAG: DUF1877 family protein [Acidobacteria bacterium]|nr:DUF1877 family protein [Acidobacteriota bacterium]